MSQNFCDHSIYVINVNNDNLRSRVIDFCDPNNHNFLDPGHLISWKTTIMLTISSQIKGNTLFLMLKLEDNQLSTGNGLHVDSPKNYIIINGGN